MAMIKKTIVKGQKPTNDQLMELEAASKMPIVYDEDSPELTETSCDHISDIKIPTFKAANILVQL